MSNEERKGWTQAQGIDLAVKVEEFARKFGFHVGLTGGCLYSHGTRKDLDLVVYTHSNNEKVSEESLEDNKEMFLFCLKKQGFGKMTDWGRVVKTRYQGGVVDLIFPQCEGSYEPYPVKDIADDQVPF